MTEREIIADGYPIAARVETGAVRESEDLSHGFSRAIAGFTDAMAAVDTTGVTPMSHPQEVTQRLREDRVTEENQRELFQSTAPAVEDGLYLVPKVIE